MSNKAKKVAIHQDPTDISKRQKKLLNYNNKIIGIKPLTKNQHKMFSSYRKGKNLVMYGCAGTGKTFLALYFALSDLFAGHTSNVLIIRSAVSSREVGYLPGTLAEKLAAYEVPYRDMISELCYGKRDVYDTLSTKGYLSFISTSYIRGLTLNDTIIIMDEIQNMTWHEISSVLTRVGENTRIILCGDSMQDDLKLLGKKQQTSGLGAVVTVAKAMDDFALIEFQLQDIVRSGFVKSFLTTRHLLNI